MGSTGVFSDRAESDDATDAASPSSSWGRGEPPRFFELFEPLEATEPASARARSAPAATPASSAFAGATLAGSAALAAA